MPDTAPTPAAETAIFSDTYAPRQSEKQDKIWPVLFALQGELDPIRKTEKNEHLRTTYADLAAVWNAIRAPLQAHGMLVVQEPVPCQRGALVTTTLVHIESGQWRSSTIYIPARKADAQAFGSALSYARRYSLLTVLSLNTTDDDGHQATLPPPAATPASSSAPPPAGEQGDADRKGWEAWAQAKTLQLMGAESLDALGKTWNGMQPDLKKAPADIRTKLTENKDLYKAKLTEKAGAIGDDVPF